MYSILNLDIDIEFPIEILREDLLSLERGKVREDEIYDYEIHEIPMAAHGRGLNMLFLWAFSFSAYCFCTKKD
jgi:hypothetical protein